MKAEQQRIAIAEACPSTFRIWQGPTPSLYYTPGDNVWILTDLLNDLNAMHEAEKVLTEAQRDSFFFKLNLLVSRGLGFWHTIHATAAQRAEAFLRTLNLWKDEP